MEKKQSLRHQNRTSNIFPFAKSHTGRKERLHSSSAEANRKCATNFHGMRDPREESKLTSLPAIIKVIHDLLFVLQFQSKGRIPSAQGVVRPQIKEIFLAPEILISNLMSHCNTLWRNRMEKTTPPCQV